MPSSQHLAKLSRYIPLWQRNIPPYRVHQPGDPQMRVFLPLFWMKLLKPDKKTPPDVVMFEVHHQMTRFDIQNYLEKIYKVPVLHVRTQQLHDYEDESNKVAPWLRDKKIAHVLLKDGTFQFPDIFGEEVDADEAEAYAMETERKQKKQSDEKAHSYGEHVVSNWFR